MECLITGWRAKAVAAMGEEERLRFVLDQIEQPLPGAREHFETGTSVVWDKRPHAEGAYILPETGHSALMPAIRKPEGRVHFAGEHAAFEPNGGSSARRSKPPSSNFSTPSMTPKAPARRLTCAPPSPSCSQPGSSATSSVSRTDSAPRC
ncbi:MULTISPECIES: FAD-dependent oxidoreductase [unclassified Streptomyces]|uniref:FAD-dependent oxidoreductase n=1 Tax=unclassified Streptomyces TaxID=2593676 RepID=UPI003862F148